MNTPQGTFKTAIGRLNFFQEGEDSLHIFLKEGSSAEYKGNKIKTLKCSIQTDKPIAPVISQTLKLQYVLTDKGTVANVTTLQKQAIEKAINGGFIQHINKIEPHLTKLFTRYGKQLARNKLFTKAQRIYDQITLLRAEHQDIITQIQAI